MASDLDNLIAEIKSCRVCVDEPYSSALPHEPRPVLRGARSARISICGQAPGTRVHASGIPFSDPSGDRLREWLDIDSDVFYDETRVAIVPMGFCFPGLDSKGGDLPPRKECSDRWRERVFCKLDKLELILPIGLYAQKWHLGKRCKSSLTETVRAWREYFFTDATPRFLPLPHPSWRNNAWMKKNTWFGEEIIPFLRKEVQNLL